MKKRPELNGIATEDIKAGDYVKFDLNNGHVSLRKDKRKFVFYKKPKDNFNLKSDDVKQ